MYGLIDDIVEERKDRIEAVNLLLAVAEKKKTVADVRAWLEKNYPDLCVNKQPVVATKKW